MVIITDLELRQVVKLYELVECSYQETAGGLLAHGVSLPVNKREEVHALFAKEHSAKRGLDLLVEQRITEGYSRPSYAGAEQTKKDFFLDSELCISMRIQAIDVDRIKITEHNGKIVYLGREIQ